MKKRIAVLFLGTSLALAACGGGSDDKGGESTQSAETIAKQNCSTCHGGNLEGAGGPSLQKIGSKYSKDEIRGIIANGKGAMPQNVIEGEDADKVAEWLSKKK